MTFRAVATHLTFRCALTSSTKPLLSVASAPPRCRLRSCEVACGIPRPAFRCATSLPCQGRRSAALHPLLAKAGVPLRYIPSLAGMWQVLCPYARLLSNRSLPLTGLGTHWEVPQATPSLVVTDHALAGEEHPSEVLCSVNAPWITVVTRGMRPDAHSGRTLSCSTQGRALVGSGGTTS